MGPSLSKVVWSDPNVFNLENTSYFEELKVEIDIKRFDNLQDTINYVKENAKIYSILISSGK